MFNFQCDYTEGAHKNIIDALVKTNMEQTSGYGADAYCESAKAKIRATSLTVSERMQTYRRKDL